METLGIKIIDRADYKHVCLDTKVLVVVEEDDGTRREIDISNFVRAVDVRMHFREPVTAALEVYPMEVETMAMLHDLVFVEPDDAEQGE